MNTWSLSRRGLATVISLEVRQRLRSKRWIIILIAWFIFIGLNTGLIIWSMYSTYSYDCAEYQQCSMQNSNAGPMSFGFITLFILGMGLVIAPAFTATTINSDRAAGTLALVQATKLSTIEILLGKLIAAWSTVAVFMVVALPFIVLSTILGNISWLQVVVCFLVIFALVAIICAIGLGWSAVFTKTVASTVVTYLTVLVLAIISPMAMLFSVAFMDQETTVRVWGLNQTDMMAYQSQIDEYWSSEYDPNQPSKQPPAVPVELCQWSERKEWASRTDLVWWMLIPNPFVIVADAAPRSPSTSEFGMFDSPLGLLSEAVREAARGPAREVDECLSLFSYNPAYEVDYQPDGSVIITTRDGQRVELPDSPVKPRPQASTQPVWPLGLGVNLIIGAGFVYLAVRRLTIPYAQLSKGTRIA